MNPNRRRRRFGAFAFFSIGAILALLLRRPAMRWFCESKDENWVDQPEARIGTDVSSSSESASDSTQSAPHGPLGSPAPDSTGGEKAASDADGAAEGTGSSPADADSDSTSASDDSNFDASGIDRDVTTAVSDADIRAGSVSDLKSVGTDSDSATTSTGSTVGEADANSAERDSIATATSTGTAADAPTVDHTDADAGDQQSTSETDAPTRRADIRKSETPRPVFGADRHRATTPLFSAADSVPGPSEAKPDAAEAPRPAGHDIKGNEGSMLYHTPDSPYYARTLAEAWFDTEQAAVAAGFTRWDARSKRRATHEGEPEVSADREAPIEPGPYGPGSADALPDGSAPAGFDIKGNTDSQVFHTRESRNYGATIAEVWFATEDAARASGFRRFDERS